MTAFIDASEPTPQSRRGREVAGDELRRRNAELAALHETALDLIARHHVSDLLHAIVERAGALIGTEHGDLFLLDPATGDLVLRVGTGVFAGRLGARLRPGEGFIGRVFATGRTGVLEDYSAWEGALPEFRAAGIRAAAAVPLMAGGEITGVLGLVHTEPGRTFGPEQGELLGRFGNLAAIALERPARRSRSGSRRWTIRPPALLRRTRSRRLPGGQERVLVVEDEDAVRALATEILGRAGYTVLAAASGSEGIRVAGKAEAIDLVISDVIMPGIRGRDATRAVRAVHPGARILYVSGYADERTIADLDAPLLSKPFAPRELLEAVRSVLDGAGSDGGVGAIRAIG